MKMWNYDRRIVEDLKKPLDSSVINQRNIALFLLFVGTFIALYLLL